MPTLAVLTDDGREFLVDERGISSAPADCKEFPNGTRVVVTDVDKAFLRFDDMAETLHLGKWVAGRRPTATGAGEVLGSSTHEIAGAVVGVRLDTGADFLFAPAGLKKPTTACAAFPAGTRVGVSCPDKAYCRIPEVAAELGLSRYHVGAKPKDSEGCIVMASTPHPVTEGLYIVGLRGDTGSDYLLDPAGLAEQPSVSKLFAVGSRCRIVNADKLYTKMDEAAKSLYLQRWALGLKPTQQPVPVEAPKEGEEEKDEEPAAKKPKMEVKLASAVAEVRGSVLHPDGTTVVVGIHTDAGPDFLVAEEGLAALASVSTEFPRSTRVRFESGKVYAKWDEKAAELGLGKWANGAKPTTVTVGSVVGSI